MAKGENKGLFEMASFANVSYFIALNTFMICFNTTLLRFDKGCISWYN